MIDQIGTIQNEGEARYIHPSIVQLHQKLVKSFPVGDCKNRLNSRSYNCFGRYNGVPSHPLKEYASISTIDSHPFEVTIGF